MIELNLQNKTATFPRRFLIQSDTLHYYKVTKVRAYQRRLLTPQRGPRV